MVIDDVVIDDVVIDDVIEDLIGRGSYEDLIVIGRGSYESRIIWTTVMNRE